MNQPIGRPARIDGCATVERAPERAKVGRVSRYDIRYVEIYRYARKHGIDDEDVLHAVEHARVR
jgi:hypothetical protein